MPTRVMTHLRNLKTIRYVTQYDIIIEKLNKKRKTLRTLRNKFLKNKLPFMDAPEETLLFKIAIKLGMFSSHISPICMSLQGVKNWLTYNRLIKTIKWESIPEFAYTLLGQISNALKEYGLRITCRDIVH